MNFKRLAVAAALGSATFSGSALAELSANVGVTSEYLFRGLAQSNGAAVQGGLDYAAESGFYVGTWASTINFASATGSGAEVDLYAGFGGEAGGTSYDIGVIYYWYAEEDEPGPQDPSLNTFEVHGSLGFGPLTLGAYAALGDYFGATNADGTAADGAYGISGELSLPMTDVLALDAKVAFHGGEGNEAFTPDRDSYIEYVFGVSAESEGGLGFGLHLIATDIDNDDPKAVISGGYSFSL